DHPHAPFFRKGLEVLAIVSGIDATYDGASRKGSYDAATPGAKGVAKDVKVMQVGGGANFWYSRNFRVMFNYMAYLTPGSGTADARRRIARRAPTRSAGAAVPGASGVAAGGAGGAAGAGAVGRAARRRDQDYRRRSSDGDHRGESPHPLKDHCRTSKGARDAP